MVSQEYDFYVNFNILVYIHVHLKSFISSTLLFKLYYGKDTCMRLVRDPLDII